MGLLWPNSYVNWGQLTCWKCIPLRVILLCSIGSGLVGPLVNLYRLQLFGFLVSPFLVRWWWQMRLVFVVGVICMGSMGFPCVARCSWGSFGWFCWGFLMLLRVPSCVGCCGEAP